MDPKPCPNCGAPKHPLKACTQCGLSNLRQERQERLLEVQQQIPDDPRLSKYGVGYQVRNRVMQEYLYDVLNDDCTIAPYQSAFVEDLPNGDITSPPLSSPTLNKPSSELLPDSLSPFNITPPKLAVRYQKAALWLGEKPVAKMPMSWVQNIQLFDGWLCPATAKYAKEKIHTNPEITLQYLQLEILENVINGTLPHPYLWRIRLGINRTKALFKDAEGRRFVKYDDDWHLAHSIRHLGGLVGGKGFRNSRDGVVPAMGYFICWESEDQARYYYLSDRCGQSKC